MRELNGVAVLSFVLSPQYMPLSGCSVRNDTPPPRSEVSYFSGAHPYCAASLSSKAIERRMRTHIGSSGSTLLELKEQNEPRII